MGIGTVIPIQRVCKRKGNPGLGIDGKHRTREYQLFFIWYDFIASVVLVATAYARFSSCLPADLLSMETSRDEVLPLLVAILVFLAGKAFEVYENPDSMRGKALVRFRGIVLVALVLDVFFCSAVTVFCLIANVAVTAGEVLIMIAPSLLPLAFDIVVFRSIGRDGAGKPPIGVYVLEGSLARERA